MPAYQCHSDPTTTSFHFFETFYDCSRPANGRAAVPTNPALMNEWLTNQLHFVLCSAERGKKNPPNPLRLVHFCSLLLLSSDGGKKKKVPRAFSLLPAVQVVCRFFFLLLSRSDFPPFLTLKKKFFFFVRKEKKS